MKITQSLILTTLIATLAVNCSQQSFAPTGLMVDLLRQPSEAVITDPQPEFSWIVPSGTQEQVAYQLLVASEQSMLNESDADLWNSGKENSLQSSNIAYSGKPLQENSSYWWQVKIWDNAGKETAWSEPQQFHTGSFERNQDEWSGQSQWRELRDSVWVAEDRQIARFEDKKPQELLQNSDTQWFADFGKAAFATLEFAVASDVEQSVEVILGERNNGNRVDTATGISNIGLHIESLSIKPGTHLYQLAIPRHVGRYPHSQKLAPFYPEVVPFRYAEINSQQPLEVKDVTQKALYYYFDDQASDFSSSNENLNQVWDLCKYTLKATPFLGVYCDGNRERMPYEADAYIQQLGHYAVDREFSAARYTILFLLSHASWPTEWQLHTVMMAHEHFMQTGDLEFIAEIYDQLKVKNLIDLAEDNYLISTRMGKATADLMVSLNYNGDVIKDIVDWPRGTPEGEEQIPMAGPTPAGERDGFVFTDFNTVVNAFHYHTLLNMQDLANALGKTEDEKFYRERAAQVKQSIIENFFESERGIFTDGIDTDHASLHANMFPVAFGIIPEGYQQSITDFIKSRGMACSVYGAQYLLEALYNLEEAEYALQLMTSESKRSWMNMLKVGSTMTTEAWDEYYKPNLTWNHAWGAAPANIIPRRMLGIQPLEPGFSRFKIEPQIDGLQQVKLEMPTIKGTIEVAVMQDEGSMKMEIEVPGNTEAIVILPSGVKIREVKGLNIASEDPGSEIILRSGSYIILANYE